MRKLTALMLGLVVVGILADSVRADEHGGWQALENDPSCVVWNGNPQEQETVTWTGGCVGGKAQGSGVMVWRFIDNGKWKESRYEGGMVSGKMERRGTFYFANGDRYEGDWRNGRQHGRGTYYFASGGRYDGEFKDNNFNGRGTMYFADGSTCEGDWRDDALLGSGNGWDSSKDLWRTCYMDDNTITFTD